MRNANVPIDQLSPADQAAARRINQMMGHPDSSTISMQDVRTNQQLIISGATSGKAPTTGPGSPADLDAAQQLEQHLAKLASR